ncbi:MAG: hypothetical protein WDM70_10350 [Nitrosomonadales bacterium]
MIFSIENPVRQAIYKIGGPTVVSNLLSISNGAVHAWIRNRKIRNIKFARRIAELSGFDIEELRPIK